jgi:alpha-D-ribose 1-methylphosphonate 5-triphosphate synthase subunit PhnH
MQAQTLSGGFTEPAIQSAHAFRSVMEAMARPGTLHDIAGAEPPAPLSKAAGCVLLTLCDTDTPVHLAGDADIAAVRAWLSFHTGAPLTGPSHCMFAVGTWDALLPLNSYPVGSSEYPDRSATLIVECAELAASGATLAGPGIKSKMYVAVKGGERAIESAHAWLAEERRGDTDVAELSIAQIREQLSLAVNRVMAEGSLYDPDLAALAIKQARGDLIEAIFLIRAYRTTLPRFGGRTPSTPARWPATGASRPRSRTCRAGRCWARPSTTPPAAGLRAGRRGAGAPRPTRARRRPATRPHVTVSGARGPDPARARRRDGDAAAT